MDNNAQETEGKPFTVIPLFCIAHPTYCARFFETELARKKKNGYLLLNKPGDLSFFLNSFDPPLILFLFKELEKNLVFEN